jgi:hypothetical protein
MTAYLSHLQAEAHAADLREQARRVQLLRGGDDGPRRLRNSAARVLLGFAVRLDHGFQPAPARPSTSGPTPC